MTDEPLARPPAKDPRAVRPGETRQEWLDRRRAERAAERAEAKARAEANPGEQVLVYDGEGWIDRIDEARELVGTDPSEALARMVAKLLTIRGPAEVAAIKAVLGALGVGRDSDYLSEEDRRWAAMTPEQRAEETLRDPVHGPLIRKLVLSQREGESK